MSWRELRGALGGGRLASVFSEDAKGAEGSTAEAVEADQSATDEMRLSLHTVKVKAKDVRLGDLLDGGQVVHKETIGDKGVVLLTVGCGDSKWRQPWLWSNEMVEVGRYTRQNHR